MKMKLSPKLAVAGMAIAIGLFSGCAHRETMTDTQRYSTSSILSFVPVTDAVTLSKWNGIYPNIRAIETYEFTVPKHHGESRTTTIYYRPNSY